MPTLTEATFTVQDEATLRGMFETTARHFRAGDWAGWAGLYSEDGFLKPPNGPTVQGRANILSWGQALPQIEAFSFDNVEVWGEGNVAYGSSGYTLKVNDLAPDTGKQLVVFRRASDAAWKVVAANVSPDLGVADASGIDSARELIDKAWTRSDADGITRYLAEDAVLLPPNASPKTGRGAINAWLREFFKHYTMTDLFMPERQVTVSGNVAVEASTYRWKLIPKDGGEPIADEVNWVGIWERRDYEWREVRGMWNSTLTP